MIINAINNSQAFCGREQSIKVFGGKLINGNQFKVRINLNDIGYPKSLERYEFESGYIINGCGIGRNPQLKLTELINFLNDTRKLVNDCDVFEKFAEVMNR